MSARFEQHYSRETVTVTLSAGFNALEGDGLAANLLRRTPGQLWERLAEYAESAWSGPRPTSALPLTQRKGWKNANLDR